MEVEAKFAAQDGRVLDRLADVGGLGGFSLGPVVTREVDDTYLDTPDRALLASGYTCRRRETGGAGTLITVKTVEMGEGAVFRREEFEVEVSAPSLEPHEWPDSPARTRVRDVIGEQALIPLLRLSQVRRTRLMSRAGRSCGELYLDDVHITGREGTHRFFEVELELGPDGTEAEFRSASEAVAAEAGLTPVDRSKFVRALALVGAGAAPAEAGASDAAGPSPALEAAPSPAEAGPPRSVPAPASGGPGPPEAMSAKARKARPGVRPTDTMAEAADKILAFQLDRMIEHEDGTRLGKDIEELHDMRVATRRMRAALRLLGPFLDADSIRPFAKALRRTGRSLGAVRDLDVFRQKADAYLRGLPDGHERDLAPLFAAWKIERARRRTAMLAYLDGSRYRSFREDFFRFLASPEAGALLVVLDTGEVRPYRVRDVLPYLIYEHAAEVWGYDEYTAPGSAVPLVRFHHLRIAAKALRYALEFFQEVLGPEAKDLISATKRLQDHLGELQDAVVACNILRDYLTWGTWEPAAGGKGAHLRSPAAAPGAAAVPGVVAFLAARQAELQKLVDTFPDVWADVAGPGFRRRLAQVVAGV